MSYVGIARSNSEREQALMVAAKSFFQTEGSRDAAILRKAFLLCEHPGYSENSPVVVCRSNGDVIASAFLISCEMPFAGKILNNVFISSISVAESSRGKGVSLVLMEEAIRVAASYNKDIAMLIARRAVDNFYTRFGFWGVAQYSKLILNILTYPQMEGKIGTIAIRSLTKDDLEVCAALYAKSYKGLFGHCFRNPKVGVQAFFAFGSYPFERFCYFMI
jgi:GNAT superfamily N-acetyltransferase